MMYETIFKILIIVQETWQNIALVALGSLVLRQEKRHRDEQRLIRRTQAAIMREVNSGNL